MRVSVLVVIVVGMFVVGIGMALVRIIVALSECTMFDRYNIIDEADLAQAVAKRFEGQPTANKRQTMANIPTAIAPTTPLSCSAA